MFLGQADVVPPIGDLYDCPDGYTYTFQDGMCHSDNPTGTLPPPSSGISTQTIALIGLAAAALLLLSFSGGRAIGRRSSSRPISRTTTKTLFSGAYS